MQELKYEYAKKIKRKADMELNHGIVIRRCIVTGGEVRKLPLNVWKQAAGPNTEQRIIKPLVAEFLFH